MAMLFPNAEARAEGLLEAFVSAVPANSTGTPETGTPETGGIVGRIYDDTVLLPRDLKTCLALAAQIDGTSASLDERRAAVMSLDAKIDQVGNELQSQSDRKFYTADEVAVFNERVEAYNATIQERASKGDAYNAAVDAYGELTASFAAQCNDKSFYAEDLRALADLLPDALRERLP